MNEKVSKLKLILFLLPGFGTIVVFVVIVVSWMIAESFGTLSILKQEVTGFTTEHWKEVLSSKVFWRYFFYSFRIGLLSSIASVLVAYPFALWFRKSFRGSMVLTSIFRIPMLIPGLVAAFLYINLIAYHGIFNQILLFLNIIKEPLPMRDTDTGANVFVLQIWKNMPFALLLLTGTVKGISEDVLASAKDLGANKLTLFTRIILPITLPAMRAVLILIFIGAIGDFSFNSTVGPAKLWSLSQYILVLRNQYAEYENAAVASLMLILASGIGAILLIIITKVFETRTKANV